MRPGVHTLEQFGEDKFVTSDLNDREWTPLCANVDGRLPADRIFEGAVPGKYLGLVGIYAATQLQVPASGPVKFKLAAGSDAAIWIDGKPQKPGTDLIAALASGTHTIVVRLDPQRFSAALRLESSDGTFLAN